jgi:hypothetical protein
MDLLTSRVGTLLVLPSRRLLGRGWGRRLWLSPWWSPLQVAHMWYLAPSSTKQQHTVLDRAITKCTKRHAEHICLIGAAEGAVEAASSWLPAAASLHHDTSPLSRSAPWPTLPVQRTRQPYRKDVPCSDQVSGGSRHAPEGACRGQGWQLQSCDSNTHRAAAW